MVCELEFPDLQTIYNKWQSRGLRVVGVAGKGLMAGETDATLARFDDRVRPDFPIVWDSDESYSRIGWPKGELSAYPRHLLMRGDGTVLYISSEFEPEALEQAIAQELGE